MSENPTEILARRYFESESVVNHYFREGQRIGLWRSEERLFRTLFAMGDRILDLGCGTGRIAFGLETLGFSSVSGADYSAAMVDGARQIAEGTGSEVMFEQADARALPWGEGQFDGVIFGFNGFFMIPGHGERLKALKEIHRILKPGGRYLFTGHDRELNNQKAHWQQETERRQTEASSKQGSDFGDVISDTQLGTMYIHSTTNEEVFDLLRTHGFENIESWYRSELSNEPSDVRQFSDECRFWKAVKKSQGI